MAVTWKAGLMPLPSLKEDQCVHTLPSLFSSNRAGSKPIGFHLFLTHPYSLALGYPGIYQYLNNKNLWQIKKLEECGKVGVPMEQVELTTRRILLLEWCSLMSAICQMLSPSLVPRFSGRGGWSDPGIQLLPSKCGITLVSATSCAFSRFQGSQSLPACGPLHYFFHTQCHQVELLSPSLSWQAWCFRWSTESIQVVLLVQMEASGGEAFLVGIHTLDFPCHPFILSTFHTCFGCQVFYMCWHWGGDYPVPWSAEVGTCFSRLLHSIIGNKTCF